VDVEVNYVAVVVAAIAGMAVGALWYDMRVFGKAWARLAKVDMKKNRGSVWKPVAVSFVATLVTAYILAHFTWLSYGYFGESYLVSALNTAFWAWLGFTAARAVVSNAFEGRPWKLLAINLSHDLATLLVIALVLGLFGAPTASQ
jgi:hypothetical protein